MTFRRSGVLLAVALAVATGTAVPAAAVPAPSSGCAQVETIAVRGTGEAQGGGSIAGPLASALRSQLTQTVQTFDLVYRAEPSDVGTFQPGRNGLAPRRTGALRTFAGVLASYRRVDDTICQRGASGNGHLRYSGDRQAAVTFVAGEVGGSTRA